MGCIEWLSHVNEQFWKFCDMLEKFKQLPFQNLKKKRKKKFMRLLDV
jgi:hypothetical protein